MRDKNSTFYIKRSSTDIKEFNKKIVISKAVVNSLFSCILLAMLLQIFQLPHVLSYALIILFFYLSFLHYILLKYQAFTRLFSYIGILTLIIAILFRKYFLVGLFSFWNQIANTLARNKGYMVHKFDISVNQTEQLVGYVLLFSIVMTLVLLLKMYFNAYQKYVTWLALILVYSFQVVTSIYSSFLLSTCLLAALFIQFTLAAYVNKGSDQQLRFWLRDVVVVVVLFAICLGIMQLFVPQSTYEKSATTVQVKKQMAYQLDELRFQKNPVHSYTEGDLTKLGQLDLDSSTALKIVMDKPTSYYLKGFVGERYTAEKWTPLKNEVTYNTQSLFYWLHKEGFHPLNQLANVEQLTLKKNEAVQMHVQNINASSQYMYVPYELKTNITKLAQVKSNHDSQILYKYLFGNRNYQIEVQKNLVTKYPKMASEIYELNENSNYLKLESYYNQFVYEQYLDIPDETKMIVKNHAGNIKSVQSIEEKISYVKSFVNESLQYNTETKVMPKDKDFIQYILEENNEGYAAHYATLATILFRYLQIPSRYVEGYLITPKMVDNAKPYEELIVKGTEAHAWTEIYLDQIGWIPIEVTPTYYNVMDPLDLAGYPSKSKQDQADAASESEAAMSESDSTSKSKVQDEAKKKPPVISKHKKHEDLSWVAILKWFVIVLIVVSVVAIICFVMYKRYKLQQEKKLIYTLPYKKAVPELLKHTLVTMQYDGIEITQNNIDLLHQQIKEIYGEYYAVSFQASRDIALKALYSQEEITSQQFEQVKQWSDEIIALIVSKKSTMDRWKMKYIAFKI